MKIGWNFFLHNLWKLKHLTNTSRIKCVRISNCCFCLLLCSNLRFRWTYSVIALFFSPRKIDDEAFADTRKISSRKIWWYKAAADDVDDIFDHRSVWESGNWTCFHINVVVFELVFVYQAVMNQKQAKAKHNRRHGYWKKNKKKSKTATTTRSQLWRKKTKKEKYERRRRDGERNALNSS